MLTTYATAMSELRRQKGFLHRTIFYRLVLEEAHTIRRRHKKQYTAVSEISATRRWCLTGTHIQNKVEDLGALVLFLKVPLLEDPEVFRAHITNPTNNSTSNQFENLRKLLECICIRRTKAIGYLDDSTVDLLYLRLSPAEVQGYNEIVRRHRAWHQMAVSLRDNANASQQIFKAFHKLRVFCNIGTRGANETTYIEVIEAPQNVECWQQEDEVQHAPFRQEVPDLHDSNLQIISRSAEESPNTQPGLKIISSEHMDSETIHSNTSSSKLCALRIRILEHPPSEKCIVFSFWRTSLDQVGAMLQRHNIAYLRIDGSVLNAERQRALCGFDNALEQIVLLMTIGTGAVGLNLTSATRVHILEPQWNPMVEQQAIGRALRLGQTRKVVVSRYIMKGTIEEHVVSSQAYKLQVALKCFEKQGSEDSVEEKVKLFNEIIPEI